MLVHTSERPQDPDRNHDNHVPPVQPHCVPYSELLGEWNSIDEKGDIPFGCPGSRGNHITLLIVRMSLRLAGSLRPLGDRWGR